MGGTRQAVGGQDLYHAGNPGHRFQNAGETVSQISGRAAFLSVVSTSSLRPGENEAVTSLQNKLEHFAYVDRH